ncbi:MAG: DsrE family protein [Tissierellia bacterium]|nr:DsrE family protein [Tissierellia bacterium]
MSKVVFFAFRNHAMCFQHLLLNAFDIIEKGGEAKIVFEGEAVKLPVELESKNPMYKKAVEQGVIAGVCEACSKAMGVYEQNKELGVTFLSSLSGHPAMEDYLAEGYQVITL